jgi:hypothetical protein
MRTALEIVAGIIAAHIAIFFWSNARYLYRKAERLERQRDRARLAIERIMALVDETGDAELFKRADRVVATLGRE